MAGFSVATDQHLIRSNIWSGQLRELRLEELMAQRYVEMVDFPDGTTMNFPIIGQMEAHDFAEGQSVTYTSMDTGNFTFTVTQYKSSATYVYTKYLHDSMYMRRVVGTFVPKMNRALSVAMEARILDIGPSGQTASGLNTINGGDHRFVASGTSQVMAPKDFARAKYALEMANVPMTNLVAVVHPSVAYAIETLPNFVNFSSPNPQWTGIVSTGLSTGMRFIRNIYGFDVYVSHYLKTSAGETIDSVTVNSSGVHNLFFSATPDYLPFLGTVRQAPKVDSEYNKDLQREEYVTTCYYDYALQHPDNLVVVLSATDQVS